MRAFLTALKPLPPFWPRLTCAVGMIMSVLSFPLLFVGVATGIPHLGAATMAVGAVVALLGLRRWHAYERRMDGKHRRQP